MLHNNRELTATHTVLAIVGALQSGRSFLLFRMQHFTLFLYFGLLSSGFAGIVVSVLLIMREDIIPLADTLPGKHTESHTLVQFGS